MSTLMEKMKIYKSYLIGIICLFFANIVWILSAELINYVYSYPELNKPFLGSYIKSCCFSFFLFSLFRTDFRNYLSSKENDFDSYALNKLENVDDFTSESLPPLISRKKCVILSCFVGFVLMLSIWTYQIALAHTTAAYVMVLGSTQSFFFLIFAAVFRSGVADKFDFTKLFLCTIQILGAVLVSQSSSPTSSSHQKVRVYDLAWLGNIFSIFTGVAYALLMVVIQYFVNRAKVYQENYQLKREKQNKQRLEVTRNSSHPSILLIFGIGGIFSLFFYFPGFFILHFTGIEKLPCELIPNSENCTTSYLMWGGFLGNGLCSSFGGELLWLQGSILTSSMVGGMALNLITPMSIITDYVFYGLVYSAQFQIGNMIILLSIFLTMMTNGVVGQNIKRLCYKYKKGLTEEESIIEVPLVKSGAIESTIPSWDIISDSSKGTLELCNTCNLKEDSN